ncbi:MAG: hypothetical protein DRG66_02390, partial [Deltaproteobacteria bacterium]
MRTYDKIKDYIGAKYLSRIAPLIGLLILSLIIYKVGPANILDAAKNARLGYFLFLPPAVFLVFLTQTFRWYLILRQQGITVQFSKLFKIVIVGMFYASVTPGQVGGFIKIKYLSDYSKRSLTECSSSLVVDKALDLITLCFFASVGSIIIAAGSWTIVIPAFFVSILLISSFLLYNQKGAQRLIRILPLWFIPGELKSSLSKKLSLFYAGIPARRSLLLPFILSILVWLLIYTQKFLIARAVSIEISYFNFIFIVA